MQTKEIVGIDVSKETFDAVIESNSEHRAFSNSKTGFNLFNKWLLKNQGKDLLPLLIVMEHTGIYSFQLEKYLHENHLPFSKVAGVQIKKSAGLVRGKSDAADAKMIARYGVEKMKTLKIQAPVQDAIMRLKNLIALRDKMVRDRAGYITRLNEQKECLGLEERDVLVSVQKAVIKSFQTGIDKIEGEIDSVIEDNVAIRKNYALLTSIKGIGPVIATYMITFTENFTAFATWRQFACYSGIAPFPYESGKSIKGKTKVSTYAYKKIKSLLHMAALTSIRYTPEMKAYYEKRIELGKNKMSTLNVIRNKIVARMFAVIKRQSGYELEWLKAA